MKHLHDILSLLSTLPSQGHSCTSDYEALIFYVSVIDHPKFIFMTTLEEGSVILTTQQRKLGYSQQQSWDLHHCVLPSLGPFTYILTYKIASHPTPPPKPNLTFGLIHLISFFHMPNILTIFSLIQEKNQAQESSKTLGRLTEFVSVGILLLCGSGGSFLKTSPPSRATGNYFQRFTSEEGSFAHSFCNCHADDKTECGKAF